MTNARVSTETVHWHPHSVSTSIKQLLCKLSAQATSLIHLRHWMVISNLHPQSHYRHFKPMNRICTLLRSILPIDQSASSLLSLSFELSATLWRLIGASSLRATIQSHIDMSSFSNPWRGHHPSSGSGPVPLSGLVV